jgi:Outer membrane protein beta-barrel domain
MNRACRAFATCAATVLSLAVPARGTAQGFLDVYAGAAFTDSDDLTTRIAGFSIHDSVDFDPSAEVGIRGGIWFPDLPWLGLASDLSYFRLDGPSSGVDHTVGGIPIRTRDDVDVDLFPISILLMLRTKVFTGPFGPRFGVQPYVGVGPTLFVSWVQDALTVRVGGEEESVDDVSYELGLDTRAGLRFHLARSLSLFAEYRFTYYEPEFEDNLFGDSVQIESDIATHHVVAGVGFQF